MWLTKGQSLGRKEQLISKLFECQNSLSGSFSSALYKGSSLSWRMNQISVDTQKYAADKIDTFSMKRSQDS